MMMLSIEAAARNNAAWCDAVCAAQGAPGLYTSRLWVNLAPTPPYYPNIITLAPMGRDLQRELESAIAGVRASVGGAFALKDSFGDLDLASLSCHVLFDAQWIARPASLEPAAVSRDGMAWEIVRGERDLFAWREAWDSEVPATNPVFVPSLLDDRDIAFIAGRRGEAIVAGGIANHHEGVIGISNVFAPERDAHNAWVACVSMATQCFGNAPIVGYESGVDLQAAVSAGFETIGLLRVWTATS